MIPTPPISASADTVNRGISAFVIVVALLLIAFVLIVAIRFNPTAADGKSPAPHTVQDVVTMVTAIGGVITSVVGLFFGINVARQGLDAAATANTTANNIAAAFQTQQTQTANVRGAVTGGLTALKAQIPEAQHSAIDKIIEQVGS